MASQFNNNGLISSVFSSAVKTSLSEHAAAKQKAASILKKKQTPPPSAFTMSSKEAVAATVSQQQEKEKSWVTVTGKKSVKNAHTTSAINAKQHTAALLTPNKSGSKPTVASKQNTNKLAMNMYHTLTKPVGPWKDTNAYHKNRRRNARRRAQHEADEQKKVQQQQQDETMSYTAHISEAPDDVSVVHQHVFKKECQLLALPYTVLTEGVLSFLRPEDMAALGACSKYSKTITEEGYLWQTMFRQRFPQSELSPNVMKEWKLAYQISLTSIVDRLRCFSTQKTFFDDVLGVGVTFTVNPKTRNVDYIDLTQDLLSKTAFQQHKIRKDVFGNKFELFLPLYFSENHFQRALPLIRKTIFRLCSPPAQGYAQQFEPTMVLDVLPKMFNTFAVLLADEGISASRKSYNGLLRIHRLFLALTHEYSIIKKEALARLKKFASHENYRTKAACPSLGSVLPLMMVVDEQDFAWSKLGPYYMGESFDRHVLWACKKYPVLERTHDASGKVESAEEADKRVELSLDAATVSLRLAMFHVYFYRATCHGTTTHQRANRYDRYFGQPEPEEMAMAGNSSNVDSTCGETKHSLVPESRPGTLSFSHFRNQINVILTVDTWCKFFALVGLKCPSSKAEMADRLRKHVKNSLRKKYHTRGMNFSRVQASGTSKILSKGQQYSASSDLRRLVFTDTWNFEEDQKFLDASCLMYEGKRLCSTVDYQHRRANGVQHSGDVMHDGGGTHTIHVDLNELDARITQCVFVISAWADATLADILSPSISFSDANADEDAPPLCVYDLDAHDKISYLTSVIMCKLYRTKDGGWHVQAIGDAHGGAADNYGPIYKAVEKLL